MAADCSSPALQRLRHDAGFSLMELAVVLMIIGTLMSGVLVAVSQSAANARITTTRAQLREIEEALYGFAQANGRLPCPATPASAGFEDPIGGGACTEIHGFVPNATLGFFGSVNDDGLLLDAWQNPVRYSVSGTPMAFTDTTEIDAMFATPSSFIGGANMLRVCDTAACSGTVLTDSAPAVVFSMGANWLDYTSADEQENGGDGSATLAGVNTYVMSNSLDFVSTTYSEDSFDDQIIWLSPYVLFNRLIEAGKLP